MTGLVGTNAQRGSFRATLAGIAFACFLGLWLGGGATVPAWAGTASSSRVVVSDSTCAQGWTATSGRTTFTIANTAGHDFFDVQLVSGADPVVAANPVTSANAVTAANAKVYGQVNVVAPGTEATLAVVLPPGRYFFRCIDSNGNTRNSQVMPVLGQPVVKSRSYSPVTPNQLAFAMQSYRAEVTPCSGSS